MNAEEQQICDDIDRATGPIGTARHSINFSIAVLKGMLDRLRKLEAEAKHRGEDGGCAVCGSFTCLGGTSCAARAPRPRPWPYDRLQRRMAGVGYFLRDAAISRLSTRFDYNDASAIIDDIIALMDQ